jgi:sulfate adenylyltransferase subunit 2
MTQGSPQDALARLNAQRRQAVTLRLEGGSLAQVAVATGLSVPTVVAAHKAWQLGGWPAVEARPRGRKPAGAERLDAADEARLLADWLDPAAAPLAGGGAQGLWTLAAAGEHLRRRCQGAAALTAPQREVMVTRLWQRHELNARSAWDAWREDGHPAWRDWSERELPALRTQARAAGARLLAVVERSLPAAHAPACQLVAHTPRGTPWWRATADWPTEPDWLAFLQGLRAQAGGPVWLLTPNRTLSGRPLLAQWLAAAGGDMRLIHPPDADPGERADMGSRPSLNPNPNPNPSPSPSPILGAAAGPPAGPPPRPPAAPSPAPSTGLSTAHPAAPAPRNDMPEISAAPLTHLQQLEAESIHILREVVAEADNPVMLYSIGKDSAVMLHLAMKAFYPAKPPFPLLHVDTRWKFREMYAMRERMAQTTGMKLLVHVNPEGVAKDINPFTHGSAIHTDIMKTEGLKQALDLHGFDAAFGGARRDEEKSRAKERIFSFRSDQHRWDPKRQRPELWRLYNARKHPGESMRVFPLSNWTELDIWQYIFLENVPIVPLYYAALRPVVERGGALIMVDDERMRLRPGEVPMMRKVRFRTLGCYPLTGAVESEADTLPAIIQEMLLTRTSERQGRVIDHDGAASMEKKKQEGYF